ncbi:hypothetical protein BM221_008988 [Beauveria bassiana]|uniref:Uncharacterized protein n=1 Tax=Beauveria bassiana TaxID=176275 RepID=A0A2N6NEC9_BEABA|nr:hypothetical protein BM221_010497 [Beauveria bassiana]PMB65627.1 hypothetical protein BM221_008988 [Beauveria bassiana]
MLIWTGKLPDKHDTLGAHSDGGVAIKILSDIGLLVSILRPRVFFKRSAERYRFFHLGRLLFAPCCSRGLAGDSRRRHTPYGWYGGSLAINVACALVLPDTFAMFAFVATVSVVAIVNTVAILANLVLREGSLAHGSARCVSVWGLVLDCIADFVPRGGAVFGHGALTI